MLIVHLVQVMSDIDDTALSDNPRMRRIFQLVRRILVRSILRIAAAKVWLTNTGNYFAICMWRHPQSRLKIKERCFD